MSTQKRVGLTGNPIGHSLSPCMHNAAYKALGLDWEYSLYPQTTEAGFNALLKQMRQSADYIGLNVTMPYKRCAYEAADHVYGFVANKARAANVVTFTPNGQSDCARIIGANTDGAGFVGFLEGGAGLNLKGVSAIICGTGPTASVAALELMRAGALSITILGRDAARARQFASNLSIGSSDFAAVPLDSGVKPSDFGVMPLDFAVAPPISGVKPAGLAGISYDDMALLEACCNSSALVIDATPVGMSKDDRTLFPVEFLTARHTVLDVVYGCGETELLRKARAKGARAFDGLGMLIEQAALTVEVWAAALGIPLEASRAVLRATMRAAALAELELRQPAYPAGALSPEGIQ